MTQQQQQTTNSSNNIISDFKSENEFHDLTVPPSQPSYVTPTTTSNFPVFPTKSTLPAFLNKLFGMVNSPDTDAWVHWSESGDSFIIPNSQALAEQVLGRHFRHNNFASFVRQLNMYGFHKVPHLNHGVLHNGGLPEVWEFTNVNFHRDEPGRMRFIVRKKGEAEKARMAAKQPTPPPLMNPQPHISDPTDIAITRAEIHQVANRQNIIREEVMRLIGSTDNLWKYALETRHRYLEQQVKLDKMIKVLSEAFRKRPSNPEFPNKVRGLLEGPSAFEELSDNTTPVHTPVEQGQLDVMKMIANGKIPLGLQEAIQQYLQNIGQGNVVPQTPVSPTSFESSEALMMYHANNNAQQLAQVHDWVNHMDQTLNGLGMDPDNPSGSYAEYLNDQNINFDSFVPASNPDPAVDTFAATDTSFDACLQPWMAQYLNSDHGQQNTSIAGQKRGFENEDEEDEASPEKRARI